MDNSFYKWQNKDLVLRIKVQPNASKDEISNITGRCVKIRITAPPLEGKANKHLIAYLAKAFKAPKLDIELISGSTGREKRVLIKSPKSLPKIIHRH